MNRCGMNDMTRDLACECDELKRRLARAERFLRCLGVLLAVAVVFSIAAGAYSTSDQILLRDSATGNMRILLHAPPNQPAYIQINAADGTRRIHLGESDRGIPNLTFYNTDGQTVSRAVGP